jgi:hypothetical protein
MSTLPSDRVEPVAHSLGHKCGLTRVADPCWARPSAWRLTGTYDDGYLVLETHANLDESSTNDT